MGRTGEHIAINVVKKLSKPRMTLSAFEKADEMQMEGSQ